MRTALDAPKSALNSYERNFVAQIRKHGWFRTSVFGDGEGPGFSYTTGFWRNLNAPEVIVFSLAAETVHDILWDMYRDLAAGGEIVTGRRLSNIFGAGAEAFLLPVAKRFYGDFALSSRWFYGGDEFPCVQLIWPDTNGTFPWEAGHETRFTHSQPDLTENGWLHALN